MHRSKRSTRHTAGTTLLLLAGLVLGCGPVEAQYSDRARPESENTRGGDADGYELAEPQPESLIPGESVLNEISREEAVAAWYEGDLARAITLYEALHAKNPDDERLQKSLVLLLREAGAFDRALQVLPNSHSTARLKTQVLAGKYTPGYIERSVTEERRENARGTDLFWAALGEMVMGSRDRAEELFSEAIAREEHRPYAHLFRGVLAGERQQWVSAVEHLSRALEQDRNLTIAFKPLAEARYALGETRAAWDLIRRAAIALPWDEDVRVLRSAWEEQHPGIVASRRQEVERRRVIAEPPLVAITPIERDSIPRVRVGLAEGLSSVHIKTGGDFQIFAVPADLAYMDPDTRLARLQDAMDATPLARGEAGTVLHVVFDRESDQLVLRPDGENTYLRDARTLRLVYDDPRHTTIVFDLAYGHGQFSAGREDRSYRGDIEIIPAPALGESRKRFTVVNDLNVEEYLYSVVPSEMPAHWPAAALQAQAVAARSYTLRRRTRFHPRGFDLLSSVASAHYRGVTGEHPRTTEAVEATRGSVLADGSRTLDAVYSANSAGYTEASESVWGFATSLVAVADPHLPPLDTRRSPAEVYRWILDRPESYSGHPEYAGASAYRWSLLVPREDIEQRLAATGIDVGSVIRVIPGARGITGRVETVRVLGTEGDTVVERDAIRSRLGGLRSNLFVVSPRFEPHRQDAVDIPTHFFFQGAGWGHGVGMCQTGAAGMAAEGHDVESILAHYYPRNDQVFWY